MDESNPVPVTALNVLKYNLSLSLKSYITICRDLLTAMCELDDVLTPEKKQEFEALLKLVDDFIKMLDESRIKLLEQIKEQKYEGDE